MGRVFRPKYAWTRADGSRVEKVTEAWYIEYTDAAGRWIRRKAGVTKEQAQDALRKAESDVLAEKNGLPTQRVGAMACKELVTSYLAARRGHVARKQAVIVTQRIRAVLTGTRAYQLSELTPEKVERFLSTLAARGLSARSQNGYLQAIKGCLTWAVQARRIPYNQLDCVQKRSEHVKVHLRRALTEADIGRLLIAAQEGPARRALNVYQNRPRKDGTYKPASIPLAEQARLAEEGRNSVLVYRLMLEAGLRRGEARQLAWTDLNLDAATLTTHPEWEGNKNGKRETLPLPPSLVEALKAWHDRRGVSTDAPVVKVTSRTLRCFDDDLVAAGLARRVPLDAQGEPIPLGPNGLPVREPAKGKVEKRDASGRVLDLHALRHTYGTRLVAAGVDIKTVQMLMRHSTPEMTLGIYVHSDKTRLTAAVAALPELQSRGTSVPPGERRTA